MEGDSGPGRRRSPGIEGFVLGCPIYETADCIRAGAGLHPIDCGEISLIGLLEGALVRLDPAPFEFLIGECSRRI